MADMHFHADGVYVPPFGFGSALAVMRHQGRPVARQGWVGRGQYIVLQPGYPDGIGINAATAATTGLPEGTTAVFRPYLLHRTQDGEFVPWAPTQTDLLAEDWMPVQGDHGLPYPWAYDNDGRRVRKDGSSVRRLPLSANIQVGDRNTQVNYGAHNLDPGQVC